MRTIIAGSRKFNDYESLKRFIENNVPEVITEILSGDCRGSDKLGEKYAKEINVPCIKYPADWNNLDTNKPCKILTNSYGNKYNALAGPNRNLEMAKNADMLIVIDYRPIFGFSMSAGTKNMINQAKKYGLKIYIYSPHLELKNE